MPFCQVEHGGIHCGWCKCRACDFCTDFVVEAPERATSASKPAEVTPSTPHLDNRKGHEHRDRIIPTSSTTTPPPPPSPLFLSPRLRPRPRSPLPPPPPLPHSQVQSSLAQLHGSPQQEQLSVERSPPMGGNRISGVTAVSPGLNKAWNSQLSPPPNGTTESFMREFRPQVHDAEVFKRGAWHPRDKSHSPPPLSLESSHVAPLLHKSAPPHPPLPIAGKSSHTRHGIPSQRPSSPSVRGTAEAGAERSLARAVLTTVYSTVGPQVAGGVAAAMLGLLLVAIILVWRRVRAWQRERMYRTVYAGARVLLDELSD